MIDVFISKSDRKGKKYKIVIMEDKRKKTIHIGASGMEDYTQHHDDERKKRYIDRHEKREYWTKSGIKSPGFWSRWLTWNLPTISGSISDIEKKFDVNIKHTCIW